MLATSGQRDSLLKVVSDLVGNPLGSYTDKGIERERDKLPPALWTPETESLKRCSDSIGSSSELEPIRCS